MDDETEVVDLDEEAVIDEAVAFVAEVMEVAEESGEDSATDPVDVVETPPDTTPDGIVELDDPISTAAEAEEQRKADCRSTASMNAWEKQKRLRG